MTRAGWLQMTTQFLGLSVREGMLLTPGLMSDLVALEKQRRGYREE